MPDKYQDMEKVQKEDTNRRDFLRKLDDAKNISVDDFEARFIENNMNRSSFSPKQREIIDQMIERYGKAVKW